MCDDRVKRKKRLGTRKQIVTLPIVKGEPNDLTKLKQLIKKTSSCKDNNTKPNYTRTIMDIKNI